MELQGNRIGPSAAALPAMPTVASVSALSPGHSPLPAVERPEANHARSDRSLSEELQRDSAREVERQARAEEARRQRPPITYEERLKQMLSVDEMRRLLFLYSPFTRALLNEEKGKAFDRTA